MVHLMVRTYICGIKRKRTGNGSLSLSLSVWLELSEPWSVDSSIKDKGTGSSELYVLDCMVLDWRRRDKDLNPS